MPRLATVVAACLAAALSTAPAAADGFRDTVAAAVEAYEAGDLQLALEEMSLATSILQELRAGALEGFLPPTPDGWTRTLDAEFPRSLRMMGGGTGVDASYRGPDGERIGLQMSADSPMLAAFAGMFANPAMMAMMGTVHRIGRERVLENDQGDLTMMIGGRILIQMSGEDTEQMLEMLRDMDLDGLARFDI